MSQICYNKKARFDYEIVETIEAGIALTGSEVKSLRAGKANLSDGYAYVKNGEIFLANVSISPYAQATINNHAEKRTRKLLLKRKEIDRLNGRLTLERMTLVPIALYWKKNKVKLELGIGKGKKQFDKRESIKKNESKRELARVRKAVHSH